MNEAIPTHAINQHLPEEQGGPSWPALPPPAPTAWAWKVTPTGLALTRNAGSTT